MRIGSIVLSTCSVLICGAAFADDSAVNRPTPGCVTVNFTGEVVEAPCVVSVGNGNSVDLGRIKKVAGKKGRITPVPFYLTTARVMSIRFASRGTVRQPGLLTAAS